MSVTLFTMFFCKNIKQRKIDVEDVLHAQDEYLLKELPDTFKVNYKNLFGLTEKISDKLSEAIDLKTFVSADKEYYIMIGNNRVSYNIDGFIWNKYNEYYFKYNIYDSSFLLKKMSLTPSFKQYKRDIEEWNENVTNVSYYYTDVSDPIFFVCSKVVANKEIFTTTFVDYGKSSPVFYLREREDNNYKPIIVWRE